MNWKQEYEAARNAAAFYPRSDLGFVCAEGKDRVRYLHGMVSNDVKGLASGKWILASSLSHKGKLVAPFLLGNVDERLWLLVEESARKNLVEALKKFVVRDDVQVEDRSESFRVISLMGPKSVEITNSIFNANNVESTGSFWTGSIEGRSAYGYIAAQPVPPTIHIVCPSQDFEDLSKKIEEYGARRLGTEAFEALRIEAGVPKFGLDVNEDRLLLEVPYLEKGVSFTKGCYVGQETVARLHARGENVAYRLMGITSETEIQMGAKLTLNGNEVGRVTSVSFSPRLGMQLGMGVVHRSAFAPGTAVTLISEDRTIPGAVVSLPLPA